MTTELDIKHLFSSLHPLTDEAWEELQALFEHEEISKNDYLIKEGERALYCYLLLDGVVRVFYSKDGNEYNKTFFVKGHFPTPITALISGEPCGISFQALTNCQLIKFSYKKFTELFNKHQCLESLMLAIMQQQWIKKEKHDIRMVTNDAAENYKFFKQQFPGLENLIPQYHIASYLGITPIQLSRIRGQKS